ncbi:MAG: DUF370 domain-containing protein [Clostridia bacterium]|nr:DUF370 domain-containing protein [Clostridia bacterium]
MILHIGWDVVVMQKQVIAILNEQTVKTCPTTRRFVETAKKENRFVGCEGTEKAYIVIDRQGQTQILASPIHPSTLTKRLGELSGSCEPLHG